MIVLVNTPIFRGSPLINPQLIDRLRAAEVAVGGDIRRWHSPPIAVAGGLGGGGRWTRRAHDGLDKLSIFLFFYYIN